MCVQFVHTPAVVPGSARYARDPALLLYKVVELRNGVHRSSRALDYPLGKFIADANAIFGDHERGIHLVPSEANARQNEMGTYGSHIVSVLAPLDRVWTSPEHRALGTAACWHADGCLPIWCMVCNSGIASPDIVEPSGGRPGLLVPTGMGSIRQTRCWLGGARAVSRLLESPMRRNSAGATGSIELGHIDKCYRNNASATGADRELDASQVEHVLFVPSRRAG